MFETILTKLSSRKFLLTLLTDVGTLVAVQLGLDPELAAKIIAFVTSTYVAVEGAGDAASRLNTKE